MFNNNDKGLLELIKKLENRISYLEKNLCVPKREKKLAPACQFHFARMNYSASQEIKTLRMYKCDNCR